MDVTPLIPQGRQIIQSYGGGTFKINGRLYHSPIIVLPEQVIAWDVGGDAIGAHSFAQAAAMADDLDIVLLGTGERMEFIPPAVRSALKDNGITIDAMDTGAACRTYNVLMAEGRRVAAFLLPTKEKQS